MHVALLPDAFGKACPGEPVAAVCSKDGTTTEKGCTTERLCTIEALKKDLRNTDYIVHPHRQRKLACRATRSGSDTIHDDFEC